MLQARWSRALVVLAAVAASSAIGPAPPSAPPRQAQASWWDRTDPGAGKPVPRSRFYTIRSDLSPEETKSYADHLDTMYVEYTRLMQGLKKRGREYLDVYIFAHQQDYIDTLRTHFGMNGIGSGGMFFVGPRGAGLAFFTEGLPRSRVEHVVQHEGFHQIANIYFDNDLPQWANEGIAEYFGEAAVLDGKVIEGQANSRVLAGLRKAIEAGQTIPFLDILTRDMKRWNGAVSNGTAALEYAQAWGMVQFLIWGESGALNKNFSAYLRNLNDGRDPAAAFRLAFGGTDDKAIADFEGRWKKFMLAQKPSSFRGALERMEFFAEGIQFLRARGIYPASLEELKQQLVAEKFEFAVGSHGVDVKLSPKDESLFEIETDSLQDAKKPPVFEYSVKGQKAASSRKDSQNGKESKDAKEPGAHENGGNGEDGDAGADGRKPQTSKSAGKPAKTPPPPEIITRNLKPRNLKLSWIRGKGDEWTYDITVK